VVGSGCNPSLLHFLLRHLTSDVLGREKFSLEALLGDVYEEDFVAHKLGNCLLYCVVSSIIVPLGRSQFPVALYLPGVKLGR